MSKVIKGMIIEDIVDRLDGATDLLVVDSSALDANTQNSWRRSLQEKEISALSVRNTLARRALERVGVSGIDPVLEGPSTLVYGGQDIVALSKEITKWAKDIEKLHIKGGSVEGQSLDEAGVVALSKSPSREEILSKISGQILSPGANLSAAMLGIGGTLAGQIKQIADKDDAEGEAETA
ncbi:50S ribosomal protein L10 [Stratiformator vulcanicus]|uniref:Large ribosomal subunit protein uL10 n=1 Tax=Stratiformator vulcanicus TaxID=2527980 RepID=A0A517R0N1_9PLAN|nr:50S ribosomal protein L10 [Stratiformator vulcanicus]QDT37394.1 50S ribosomal protein L10 [Stratiformator vulcanicus]